METTNEGVQRETSVQPIPEVVRKLMADVSDTVVVIGRDFRPVWWSSPDSKLFGRAIETWEPRTLSDLLHPGDQVWLEQKQREILEMPDLTIRGHLRVQDPDGNYSTVLLTAVNRLDDPAVNGLIITATPTLQKLNETPAKEDLGRSHAVRRQDEVLGQVRSQIEKTLSTTALSTTAIPIDARIDPTLDAHIAELDAATQTLRAMLDDIVDLSRRTAGTMDLDSLVFSPARLMSDVARAFEPVCKQKGVELTLRLDPELPSQVRGDPIRLEQVIHHLASNAISTTTGGAVCVELTVLDDARIQFRISESGNGGSTRRPATSALDRRRQSDADVRLSIARQIVELMGGSFGYETSDRGTAIWFGLTFGRARRINDRPSDPEEEPSACVSAVHVLVVDDSDVNRLLATSQLERLGHTFSTAESGHEALDALTNETFDAVLMDWHMPGMDGLEATRRWRAEHDPEHELPIITMTASAMAGDRERCLEAGASDYLSKPVSINDLGTMITRWTRASSPSRTPLDSSTHDSSTHDSAADPDDEPPSYDQSRVAALITDLGDVAVVRSIVKAFVEMVPHHRSAAEAALVQDDHATIRRCAHTLKSTALMLGTDELAASCIRLEAAAAVGQSVDLTVPVTDFARCCHRAEVTLADLAAQLDTDRSPTS